MAGIDKRTYTSCQPLRNMTGWIKDEVYKGIAICELFNGRFAIFSLSLRNGSQSNYRVYDNMVDLQKDFVLNP